MEESGWGEGKGRTCGRKGIGKEMKGHVDGK
jgi:hypothetical protein